MSKEQVKKWLEQAIEESKSLKLDCLLCERPADMLGVFIPAGEMSQKIGAPIGKTRVVVYPICSKCCDDPMSELKVEGKLMERASAKRN